jgi:hypothetical protein
MTELSIAVRIRIAGKKELYIQRTSEKAGKVYAECPKSYKPTDSLVAQIRKKTPA